MEAESLFAAHTAASLLLMSVGAFMMPLLLRRVKLPAAVGEILFGVAVGPYALGWVDKSGFIAFLSQVGFFLLMFIAGLELDFRRLERGGKPLLWRGLRAVLAVFACSFATVWFMQWPWFVGLVLACMSIGVPLVLLQESGQGKSAFGQDVLLVGSMGEVICIVLATILNARESAGGFNAQFGMSVLELTAVMALAYVILVVLRTLVWWKSEAFSRVVETHDASEIGVRAGMALLFVFVAVTAYFHIEPILGAFVAGALFSFVFRHKGPLEVKFLSLGNGFFVPFFFISVGLDFNLSLAVQGDAGLFAQMLLFLCLVRMVALLLARPPEQSVREAVCAALALSAPLTLLVVMANLGLHLKLVDDGFHATVILLAVISSTVYPFLAKLTIARWIATD